MIPSRAPPTLILDLDGTLVDSAVTITATINTIRDRKRLPPLEIATVKPLVALGADKLIRTTLPYQDIIHSKKLEEFRRIYLNARIDRSNLFDGVEETLTFLRSLGMKLAICTNKPRPLAEKTLKETGIAHQFDCIVCGSEAPDDKPAPDQVFLVLEMLGSQSQDCLFIGDTRVDHEASLAAGIEFLYFPSGYDPEINWTNGLLQFPTQSFSSEIILEAFRSMGHFSASVDN
ncbi:MAG: HAD family hydrolase [Candidatus Puniceispirillaceae bacterium]